MKKIAYHILTIALMLSTTIEADYLVVRVEPLKGNHPTSLSVKNKQIALLSQQGQEPDFINPPTNHLSDITPIYEPHTTLVWDIKKADKYQFKYISEDDVIFINLNNHSKPAIYGQIVHNSKHWSQFDVQLKPRFNYTLSHSNFRLYIDYLSQINASFDHPVSS